MLLYLAVLFVFGLGAPSNGGDQEPATKVAPVAPAAAPALQVPRPPPRPDGNGGWDYQLPLPNGWDCDTMPGCQLDLYRGVCHCVPCSQSGPPNCNN